MLKLNAAWKLRFYFKDTRLNLNGFKILNELSTKSEERPPPEEEINY